MSQSNSNKEEHIHVTSTYLKNIPYIECGEDRFYSDRFYLNATFQSFHDNDDHKSNANENDNAIASNYAYNCNCANPNAPPLFDRWKLMSELDLVGCICATYVFDPTFLSSTLPKLFPSASATNANTDNAALPLENQAHAHACTKDSSQQECVPTLLMYNDGRSRKGEQIRKRKRAECSTDDEDGQYSNQYREHNTNKKVFRESVFLTAINCKSNRGVFHPKFSLLFERSGDLVVIVSSGNFTCPTSVDGSWCQRFRRKKVEEVRQLKQKWTDRMRYDGSDFGWVLAGYLSECGKSVTNKNSLTPGKYLQKVLGFKSLDHFVQSFHFKEAQVHLIATVPGVHGSQKPHGFGAKSTASVEDRNFLYGPQRVADILRRQSKASRPWLQEQHLSTHDMIALQPTSIGSKWSTKSLGKLVMMYLGKYEVDSINGIDESKYGSAVKSAKILWPSRKFMESCKEVAARANDKWWGLTNQSLKENDELILGHFAFLSSATFNSLDHSCLSRFYLYKASKPPQIDHFSPHFKSYARISAHGLERYLTTTHNNRSHEVKKKGKSNVDFPWFMLTSACLSFGAQGDYSLLSRPGHTNKQNGELDEVKYYSFELGVLF